MDKRFLGVILVIILIFGGVLLFNKNSNGNGNAQPTNHVMGTAKNNVTLLEYGDYQCPACGRYYPVVKQVVAEYQDRIQFQFRNLPLNQIHQNAYAGARAAEAAALQNKFWQMHDALYEGQASWSESSNPKPLFDNYAKGLGLNIAQFDKDFASDNVNGTINADIAAFNKTGATTATPSFFLNGKQINPGASASDFEALLNSALKNTSAGK